MGVVIITLCQVSGGHFLSGLELIFIMVCVCVCAHVGGWEVFGWVQCGRGEV